MYENFCIAVFLNVLRVDHPVLAPSRGSFFGPRFIIRYKSAWRIDKETIRADDKAFSLCSCALPRVSTSVPLSTCLGGSVRAFSDFVPCFFLNLFFTSCFYLIGPERRTIFASAHPTKEKAANVAFANRHDVKKTTGTTSFNDVSIQSTS